MEAKRNGIGMEQQVNIIEVQEVTRCSLGWCNAWREGDICSWAWDLWEDEPFSCKHPRGTINVVDEKEVSFEVVEEAGQFSLECD